jgi:hypothetical protein
VGGAAGADVQGRATSTVTTHLLGIDEPSSRYPLTPTLAGLRQSVRLLLPSGSSGVSRSDAQPIGPRGPTHQARERDTRGFRMTTPDSGEVNAVCNPIAEKQWLARSGARPTSGRTCPTYPAYASTSAADGCTTNSIPGGPNPPIPGGSSAVTAPATGFHRRPLIPTTGWLPRVAQVCSSDHAGSCGQPSLSALDDQLTSS